jgi:saccharopine dehydrogenase (NADP+, L-glutamate forming)
MNGHRTPADQITSESDGANMKKVLILGAGYTIKPMVDYFIDKCQYEVVMATRTASKAEAVIAGRPLGTAVSWLSDDLDALDGMVQAADIVIVMIPRSCHMDVASLCLKHQTTMITTDFKHAEIESLDEEAKKRGVLILTELGEDPGIDNMGLMQVVDDIKAKNGKITDMTSYGAGLPSFEDNRNPFGYKFSWDPLGLMRSALSPEKYFFKGQKIEANAKFVHRRIVEVDGIGTFETYPSNDATRYLSIFGLDGDISIYKGLLRFLGWSNTMIGFLKMELIENTRVEDLTNTTYAQFMARVVGVKSTDTIRADVAHAMGLPANDDIIQRLEWLGLFADEQVTLEKGTNSEVLVDAMLKKMAYGPDEKDMIIVHNEITAEFPDRTEKRISSMLVEGTPGGDTAMAGAVALPTAIAARLILEGKIGGSGVTTPTTPEMYEPILEELSSMGFAFKSKTVVL